MILSHAKNNQLCESGKHDLSHIYNHVFISNYKVAKNIDILNKNNIETVLYVGSQPNSNIIKSNYNKNNINHAFVYMTDTIDTNINDCFEQAWSVITDSVEQKKNILVHCRQGVSRSPTVVAYYLMRILYDHKVKQSKTMRPVLNEVLDLIQMYRPCIKPNINFVTQLKHYEKKLLTI
jgi:predicted protein tyrosine phosphatase